MQSLTSRYVAAARRAMVSLGRLQPGPRYPRRAVLPRRPRSASPRPRLVRSRVELVPDAARFERGVRYILGLGGPDEEILGDPE